MSWSAWKELTLANVESVITDMGIYRIRLDDSQGFIIQNINGKQCWNWNKLNSTYSKLATKESLRASNTQMLISNLVYVGKAEGEDGIKGRLKDHVDLKNQNGAKSIHHLLNAGYKLFFSYMKTEAPETSEQNFYNKYVKLLGYCPPGDACSSECKSANGKCTDTYIPNSVKINHP